MPGALEQHGAYGPVRKNVAKLDKGTDEQDDEFGHRGQTKAVSSRSKEPFDESRIAAPIDPRMA